MLLRFMVYRRNHVLSKLIIIVAVSFFMLVSLSLFSLQLEPYPLDYYRKEPLDSNGELSLVVSNSLVLLRGDSGSLVFDNLFLEVFNSVLGVEREVGVFELLTGNEWFSSFTLSVLIGDEDWSVSNVIFLPDDWYYAVFDGSGYDGVVLLSSGSYVGNVSLLPYDVTDSAIIDGSIAEVPLVDIWNGSLFVSSHDLSDMRSLLRVLSLSSDCFTALLGEMSNRSLVLPVGFAEGFLNQFNFFKSLVRFSFEFRYDLSLFKYSLWSSFESVAENILAYDGIHVYYGFSLDFSDEFQDFVSGVTKELYRAEVLVFVLDVLFFLLIVFTFLSFGVLVRDREGGERRVFLLWGIKERRIRRLYFWENVLLGVLGFVLGSVFALGVGFLFGWFISFVPFLSLGYSVSFSFLVVVFLRNVVLLGLVFAVISLLGMGVFWVLRKTKWRMSVESNVLLNFVVISLMIYGFYWFLGFLGVLVDRDLVLSLKGVLFFADALLLIVVMRLLVVVLGFLWGYLDRVFRVRRLKQNALVFHLLKQHSHYWWKIGVIVLLSFLLLGNTVITPYRMMEREKEESYFYLGGDVLVETSSAFSSQSFDLGSGVHVVSSLNFSVYFNVFGQGLFVIVLDPSSLQYFDELHDRTNPVHDEFFVMLSWVFQGNNTLFSNTTRYNLDLRLHMLGGKFIWSGSDSVVVSPVRVVNDDFLFLRYFFELELISSLDAVIMSVSTFSLLYGELSGGNGGYSLIQHFSLFLLEDVSQIDRAVSVLSASSFVVRTYSVFDVFLFLQDTVSTLILVEGVYLLWIIPFLLFLESVFVSVDFLRRERGLFISLVNLGFSGRWIKKLLLFEYGVSLGLVIFLVNVVGWQFISRISQSLYVPRVPLFLGFDLLWFVLLLDLVFGVVLVVPFVYRLLREDVTIQRVNEV